MSNTLLLEQSLELLSTVAILPKSFSKFANIVNNLWFDSVKWLHFRHIPEWADIVLCQCSGKGTTQVTIRL